jgi:hypothetical protein
MRIHDFYKINKLVWLKLRLKHKLSSQLKRFKYVFLAAKADIQLSGIILIYIVVYNGWLHNDWLLVLANRV